MVVWPEWGESGWWWSALHACVLPTECDATRVYNFTSEIFCIDRVIYDRSESELLAVRCWYGVVVEITCGWATDMQCTWEQGRGGGAAFNLTSSPAQKNEEEDTKVLIIRGLLRLLCLLSPSAPINFVRSKKELRQSKAHGNVRERYRGVNDH